MGHTLAPTISGGDYSAVYNALSFVVASMGATTIYIFMHAFWVAKQYKSAVTISGIVTLIACYHYFRIFNSWTGAYDIECNFGQLANGSAIAIGECEGSVTGKPFNDAYRYMDWLLTVPLLLVEVVLIMNLKEKTTMVSVKLGTAAALMIILGYPGEVSDSNGVRWGFWAAAMVPFIYIVYTLFLGLKDAVEKQPQSVRGLISMTRYLTILSWCTYPIVFVLPMLGLSAAKAEIGIQIGYSVSDVIAKCIVGLMVTKIATMRSAMNNGEDEPLIN